jgi:hypothetical protein
VDGWVDVKAGLRTACPQSKNGRLTSFTDEESEIEGGDIDWMDDSQWNDEAQNDKNDLAQNDKNDRNENDLAQNDRNENDRRYERRMTSVEKFIARLNLKMTYRNQVQSE